MKVLRVSGHKQPLSWVFGTGNHTEEVERERVLSHLNEGFLFPRGISTTRGLCPSAKAEHVCLGMGQTDFYQITIVPVLKTKPHRMYWKELINLPGVKRLQST
jgi:hypothetical protein